MDGLKLTVPFDPDVIQALEGVMGFTAARTSSIHDFLCFGMGEFLCGIMRHDRFYAVERLPEPMPRDAAERLLRVCDFFRRWSFAKSHRPGYSYIALTVREKIDPLTTYILEREAAAGRLSLPYRVVDIAAPEKDDGKN